MKQNKLFKLWLLAVILFAGSVGQALALSAGDIAIIAVNTDATKSMTFVALADIPANTTISFTDNGWNATTQTWRSGEGTSSWSHSSLVTAGTIINISMPAGTWSVNIGTITKGTTSIDLSASGDQILVYEGTTAPTTNSSSTWLFGFSTESFVYANNSNTSDIPTALSGASVAMTTSNTETDNAYFANGSTAQTAVSVSGTKAELLALFNDASKYYKNDTGPLTIPAYTITVTTSINAPTTQASNITFSNIGQNGMTTSWTNGNGAKRVVIMNTSNSFTNPTDGTDPTANTVYSGSGEQVVYNGSNNTVAVTGLSPSTTYWFRVYEYNGTGATTKYFTDAATGNPNSQATSALTPSITVTETTLTGFTYVQGAGPSAEQSFKVSGSNLTADISIAAPTNYEISKTTGTGWATPLTFTPTSGTVAEQTVYVRLKAGLTAGSYNNEVITASSTGATDKTVTCSGTVSEPPTITFYFRGPSWMDNNPHNPQIWGPYNGWATPPAMTYNVVPGWWSVTVQVANASAAIEYQSRFAQGGTTKYQKAFENFSANPTFTTTTGKIWIDASQDASFSWSGNDFYLAQAKITENQPIDEPANHVTGFAAATVAPTYSSIKLDWTDASGATNYLIKGSDVSYASITAPVDGTAEADGTLVKNVAAGTGTYTFTGLTSDKTYYFKIFPYNGTGTAVNFKTDGSVPQASATTSKIPTLLLVEDFVYTATTDLTANGWNITGSTATPTVSVSASTITYPGYLSSGIGNETSLSSSGGQDVNRTFAPQIAGTVYASCLVNVTSATTGGDYFFHLGPQTIGTTFRGRVFVKKDASNNLAFGIAQSTTSVNYTAFNYALNTTYLIVLKFDIVDGATNDVSAIYINPTLNAVEPASGWLANTDASGADVSDIGAVALRQGGSSSAPALKLDGIRVATRWADIVGEIPTFTGTGDWSTPANWNTGTVPGSTALVVLDADATISSNVEVAGLTINTTKTLTVNAGKQLTVSGTATNNGTIKLLSGTDGTATLVGNVGGNAIVEQNLSAVRNWYMSSPVSDATGLPTASTGTLTFYSYPEDDAKQEADDTNDPKLWTKGNYWETVSTGTFAVGKGYIVLPSASTTISFSGKLNAGDKNVGLTYTSTNPKKGYNLIGNPYPSHLTWTKAFVDDVTNAALIEPTIWVRTNSSGWIFMTYNGTSGLAVPNTTLLSQGIIPPMQAFWVRAKTSGTLTLDSKLTRSHQTSNPLKAPAAKTSDRQLVRLQVSNGSLSDEMVIYSDANASNSYDAYDSPKMMNSSSSSAAINMFTTVGSENLVIDGRNTLPLDVTIPVSFATNAFASGSYTISANELTNIPSSVTVKIIDNGVETSLSEGGTYTFTAAAGTTKTLGLILRSPGTVTGVENGNADYLNVYANGNRQIMVNAPAATLVNVFNATGQRIASKNMSGTSLQIDVPAPGVYMVSVGGKTFKIVAP